MSIHEYTPTTEDVERIYEGSRADQDSVMPRFSHREFNRWLFARLADAWDEGVEFREVNRVPFPERCNPYREGGA